MRNIYRTIAVCGDGLVADAVALALRDSASIERVPAQPRAEPANRDGLIVASPRQDVSAHPAAHQAGHSRRIPWLPIHIEPGTAVVGPVTRPDRPGCPVCLGLRRKNNPAPET